MFGVRARLVLRIYAEGQVALLTNPIRRIIYGVIAATLITGFAVALNSPGVSFSGRAFGLILLVSMTTASAVVALLREEVRFDSSAGELRREMRIAGLRVRSEVDPLRSLTAVVIQNPRFFSDSQIPASTPVNSRLSSYMNRKNSFGRLVLELGDRMVTVDESNSVAELEQTSQALSRAIGRPWRRDGI